MIIVSAQGEVTTHILEEVRGLLGCAIKRLEISVDASKARRKARGPLKVVVEAALYQSPCCVNL